MSGKLENRQAHVGILAFSFQGLSMLVRNVNHSIHSCGNGKEKQEIFFQHIDEWKFNY